MKKNLEKPESVKRKILMQRSNKVDIKRKTVDMAKLTEEQLDFIKYVIN
jgi:hypothetical protein